MAGDPSDLGGGSTANAPLHVPGPPNTPTPNDLIIRGMSGHQINRLQALVDSVDDVGAISVQLSIPSSVVVMFKDRRELFNSIRQPGPMDLGDGPGIVTAGGGNYLPGVRR